jgi:hypothetical protein
MCLECLERFGVPLDPAHHAALKRRPNRHIRRVKKVPAPTVLPPAKNARETRSKFPR